MASDRGPARTFEHIEKCTLRRHREMNGLRVAIVGDVPVHVLRHAVASYPTASELWLRLLEELPDVRTGLARSERQLLEPLLAGALDPGLPPPVRGSPSPGWR